MGMSKSEIPRLILFESPTVTLVVGIIVLLCSPLPNVNCACGLIEEENMDSFWHNRPLTLL